jgi:pimeloyl-ACP methyl ester carboxylesterase
MIVFVHGNPETAALWDEVRDLVEQPSSAISLPGFGTDRPADFGTTKDDYVAWLAAHLESLGEPIDLVGHDWGAALTYRIATTSALPLRSWAADVANIMHHDYVWHDFAKIWQTPGKGEEYFRTLLDAGPELSASVFETMGVPTDAALRMAGWMDERMGQSVLDLYRSATPNLFADWGEALGPTAAPGLVLHPSEDPFSDDLLSREVAHTLGADHRVLPGVGHWWPLQAPGQAVELLTSHWRSAG